MQKKVVEINGKYFEVGNIASEIICLVNTGFDDISIINKLKLRFELGQDEEKKLSTFIDTIRTSAYNVGFKRAVDSIKFRKNIYSPIKHLHLLKRLTFLFNKIAATVILMLFLSSTVYFFSKFGFSRNMLELEWVDGILFYVVIFLTMFIHELGHTVAAIKHGKCPTEIGIGLYIIFPVLYTDVSSSWMLPPTKRIEINFGGLYFQSMLSCVFTLLAFVGDSSFFKALFFSNIIMMLYSLNPFFKYDGYWIYSDFFSLRNLRNQSSDLTKKLIYHPANLLMEIKKKPFSLIFYTILNNIFFLGQVYLLFTFTRYNVHVLVDIIDRPTFSNINEISKATFNISINLVFLVFIYRRFRKYIICSDEKRLHHEGTSYN